MDKEIIILGGGLAGLTAGIHLSKIGFLVVVIEKSHYPKHKVCGEYVSNEVLPYLTWLGIDLSILQPSCISKFQFSNVDGDIAELELPLGGFGISRFKLDEFLYHKAIGYGCQFLFETVESIEYDTDEFSIILSSNQVLKATTVLGAFGKRSLIDVNMKRDFILKKSPWLAVKAHYSGVFDDNLVGLHNFNGGYCGISKVEGNIINVCYLSNYDTFQPHRNIEQYQREVVSQNPNLRSFFENSKMLFEKPITISQVSFADKKLVENHILMIGDSAGMIHPLCGNGMAMAIHSAKIASECLQKYYSQNQTREQLEKEYKHQWNIHFGKRIRMGRILSQIFQNPKITRILLRIFVRMPTFLNYIVKQTHGKPIELNVFSRYEISNRPAGDHG